MNRQTRHRAQAPSGSILDALAGFLEERWEQLLHQREITLRHPGLDEIHDLRVASRRLRAVIEQLEPFLGPEPVRRMKRPIRRLTRMLGDLRNLDEAQRYFEQFDAIALEPMLTRLARQRNRDLRVAGSYLKESGTLKLDRRINHAVSALRARTDSSSRGVLALLAEQNLLLYRPIHDLLPDSTKPKQVEQRHCLRIAIKKWRYFTELLARILASDQAGLLEQLRQYQTILGNMNDLQVFRTMLPGSNKLPGGIRQALRRQMEADHCLLLADYKELTRKHPLHYSFPTCTQLVSHQDFG